MRPRSLKSYSAVTAIAVVGALGGCGRRPATTEPAAAGHEASLAADPAMGLGYVATCGADVNVYFVWFPPVPHGSSGYFVSLATPAAAAPFRVEPMLVTPLAAQGGGTGLQAGPGPGGASQGIEGRSASLYLRATLDNTGYYIPSSGHDPVGHCKIYPHPSGVSVGN